MNPRHKDRVTYAHQVVQVDLTQVMADVSSLLSSSLALDELFL